VTRLSRSLNNRNDSLRALLKSAGTVSGVLAQRSQQLNTLILNANDLIGVLNDRREAIVGLLNSVSALSKELSGLVADNEKELAPTLTKLNSVNAMLERNRDNIAKALPGLAKYQITQGEAVASGYFYDAFVSNLLPSELLQPFFDYAFGFRRGVNAGQPPDTAGPRAELPCLQRHSRWSAMNGKLVRLVTAAALVGLLCGAGAFVVNRTLFAPSTITAYFISATAIYPGDEVRVAGVKVGSIASIEPVGGQAKMVIHVDRDVPVQRTPRRSSSPRVWSQRGTCNSPPPTRPTARRWPTVR